jgi:signal transduction histidine kinase
MTSSKARAGRPGRCAARARRVAGAPDLPLVAAAVLGTLGLAQAAASASGEGSARAGSTAIAGALALALGSTVPLAFVRTHLVPAAAAIAAAVLLTPLGSGVPTAAGLAALGAALYLVGLRCPPVVALLFAVPFVAYAVGAGPAQPGGKPLAVGMLTVAALAPALGVFRTSRRAAVARAEADWAYADTLLQHAARGERARIARELHDIVAHHISALSVQAETARLTTPGLPPEGAEKLLAIGDTAREALTEMRRLLGVLRDDATAAGDGGGARGRAGKREARDGSGAPDARGARGGAGAPGAIGGWDSGGAREPHVRDGGGARDGGEVRGDQGGRDSDGARESGAGDGPDCRGGRGGRGGCDVRDGGSGGLDRGDVRERFGWGGNSDFADVPDGGGAGVGSRADGRRPQPGLDQVLALVDQARDATGTVVRLTVRGAIRPLDPGVELAAYRIAQEALTNSRRHAPGCAVDVELHYGDEELRVTVRDSGPGGVPRPGGHGLIGMRERTAMAGGTLEAGPGPFTGFVVDARLPLAPTTSRRAA